MDLPPEFQLKGESQGQKMVCKLHKSLYGLKQASRKWNEKFIASLVATGFHQSKADYSLFTRNNKDGFVALLVYVDDIILGSSSLTEINSVKAHLHDQFKIRELGVLKYFLGLEVARSNNGIHVCQRKYALEIIESAGLLGSKVVTTPMEPNLKLSHSSGEYLSNVTGYRRLIGKLIYLSTTRPDITYSVGILNQFMDKPTHIHLHTAHRILRYLKGSIGQGIFLSSKSSLHLKGYSDSDWVACPETRRSITGFCMFIGDSLISWKSKKQIVVSRSSAEAEYRALAQTSCEVIWLKALLEDFNIKHSQPVLFYCDSQSAIHLTKNLIFHERTKHMEIDCHFVREKVLAGVIKPVHVPSKFQVADILTKALTAPSFHLLLSKMGILNIYAHLEGKSQKSSKKP
ncbi:uncharacterized mitochondrial protein AtMg00810-like [Carya illinoinensis]|uniref:uncharacterized mitochondrial protein AtMg00810-like n=1 Tax=Carya illinoinensis TaxID=32201 RepID=UPI001C71BA1C|nr:uncharacterized mitochondrial protein AtMg00810-like [Carya illinoinensis]